MMFPEVTHTFATANSGTLAVDGSVISCLSTGLITDSLTPVHWTFLFGDDNDKITFQPSRLTSGSSATVELGSPIGSLTANAGDRNNKPCNNYSKKLRSGVKRTGRPGLPEVLTHTELSTITL